MKHILIYLISACTSASMIACTNKTIQQSRNEDYQLEFSVSSYAWYNPKLDKIEEIMMTDCDKIKQTKIFIRNLSGIAKKYNPPPPLPSKIGDSIILYNNGHPFITTSDDDLGLVIDPGSNDNQYIISIRPEGNKRKSISRKQYNKLIDFLKKNGDIVMSKETRELN